MYQPYTEELFTGANGQAWLERGGRRTPLATRACEGLSEAVLCSTTPEMFATPGALARFEAVASRVRMCRYGGDCYSYCMLAMGQLDLVIESSLQPYDVQALIPIVEAAGGGIVNWRGESAVEGGSVIAYGDPRLRDAALELLDGG